MVRGQKRYYDIYVSLAVLSTTIISYNITKQVYLVSFLCLPTTQKNTRHSLHNEVFQKACLLLHGRMEFFYTLGTQ